MEYALKLAYLPRYLLMLSIRNLAYCFSVATTAISFIRLHLSLAAYGRLYRNRSDGALPERLHYT